MFTVDLIADILKKEGVKYLFCYPRNPMIEAAAAAGIRPIVCRSERNGVHIADGYSRVSSGKNVGVFAMQSGPGVENAFPGVATAFSDSVPILLLPLGKSTLSSQISPNFSPALPYKSITRYFERIENAEAVTGVMQRAFSHLRTGRFGPVMVEIPEDISMEKLSDSFLERYGSQYHSVKSVVSSGDIINIEQAAKAIMEARCPIILAGQGVLYAEASEKLAEFSELLGLPVVTTLEGKSSYPEDNPYSLGTACLAKAGPAYRFLEDADVIFGIGCSFVSHMMSPLIPSGKVIIHATNDSSDLNKSCFADYPILGDAKLILTQLIDVVKDTRSTKKRNVDSIKSEIQKSKSEWYAEWKTKLQSNEVPLSPYRILNDFMHVADPMETIVTHDSGSPREQIVPFYVATKPWGYIGWGKSHALGSGLGIIMGAKVANPDKFCVNFMGDAAFGMTGLDFETAVRCNVPILTIVFNNYSLATSSRSLAVSHDLYKTRDTLGDYADIARSLGGYGEKVEQVEDIIPAIERAKKATENGQAALLEFITCEEYAFSYKKASVDVRHYNEG